MVGLLMLFAFAVPWEYALDLGEPLGNVARILGLVLLAVMVLRANIDEIGVDGERRGERLAVSGIPGCFE